MPTIGNWVFHAGFAVPVIASVVYFLMCPDPVRPCGGGGPGTCFGPVHWNCINPGYVLIYSSIGAIAVIGIGRMIQPPASRGSTGVDPTRIDGTL